MYSLRPLHGPAANVLAGSITLMLWLACCPTLSAQGVQNTLTAEEETTAAEFDANRKAALDAAGDALYESLKEPKKNLVNGSASPAGPTNADLSDLTKTIFNTPRYAVVMGINNYADDDINDLELCENDAQAVYNLLIDPAIGGVPKEHATLLLGSQASANGIRRALSPLGKIAERSVVFVYYSGHGMKAGDEAFWVTQDAIKDDLTGTALSDTDVQRYLKLIPSDRVIVMIDACYAAATAKGNKAVDVSASLKKFTGKGRAILSAAGDGEEAIEAADLEHSVFTYFLLQALRGAADTNTDGVLVLPEITNYLDEQVADAARARKGVQRPVVDLAGVQEPAKFSVVIDAPRLQALASESAATLELRATRMKALKALALDDLVTVEQFKEAQRLLSVDPAKLSELDALLLVEYSLVLDGIRPTGKLTKALELVRATSIPSGSSVAGSKAGETMEITLPGDIPLTLSWCPAGTFQMGSPLSEEGRYENEDDTAEAGGQPVPVTLARGFWMGQTEVTQAQWVSVMGSNPSSFSAGGQDSDKVTGQSTDSYPVENVSWYDAIEFCNRLSQQADLTPHYRLSNVEREKDRIISASVTLASSGKGTAGKSGYRLPTEAEWEYACRAGTTTPFHFGGECNGTQANVSGKFPYGTQVVGPNLEQPTLVGAYPPNAWGLSDMHGNVQEWCFDVSAEKLSKTRNLTSGVVGADRVVRGGAWFNFAWVTRAAYRIKYPPDTQNYGTGFRIIQTP